MQLELHRMQSGFRGSTPEHSPRRVAGQDLGGNEHDDRDDEDGDQGERETPKDELEDRAPLIAGGARA